MCFFGSKFIKKQVVHHLKIVPISIFADADILICNLIENLTNIHNCQIRKMLLEIINFGHICLYACLTISFTILFFLQVFFSKLKKSSPFHEENKLFIENILR